MSLSRRSFAAGALLGATALRPALAADLGETLLGDVEGLGGIVPAVEAYVYGYSLVTMEMTRRVMTNVATRQGRGAPGERVLVHNDVRQELLLRGKSA